jgi:hypothetical protein
LRGTSGATDGRTAGGSGVRDTGIVGAGEAVILEGARDIGIVGAGEGVILDREVGVGDGEDRGGKEDGIERMVGAGDGPERGMGEGVPRSMGEVARAERTVGTGDGPERGGGEPRRVLSSALLWDR